MKRVTILPLIFLLGCATNAPVEAPSATPEVAVAIEREEEMVIYINEEMVEVAWEENQAVKELQEKVKEAPVEIQMSMYGGFEQVGSLGFSLTREDSQMVTSCGDLVLYSGDQIVVFYGSNSWAYTKLGKITSLSDEEIVARLSKGDVTLTFQMDAK
ncbi:MAG: hypothetical protein J6D29_03620 [Solobacterium sp.]|nr:hypothetical protein [Solobacterium sp.]